MQAPSMSGMVTEQPFGRAGPRRTPPSTGDADLVQTPGVRNTWALLVIANAVQFGFFLHRQHYRRLWLAVVAALLIGPLIWLWWAFLLWRGKHQVTAD